MKKLNYCVTLLTVTALLFTGCGAKQGGQAGAVPESTESTDNTAESVTAASQVVLDTEFTAKDLEVGYEESTAVNITLKGSSITADGGGVSVKDNVLTISQEGTFVISGALDNGQILVDAGDSDKIHIILDGAAVSCKDNAPIYIKNADKVFITLKEGTTNTLTDGAEYVQEDDNNVDGAIFSKADLTVNGNGALTVTGNYKHGIVSKDDLVITGGNITVTAVKDALNGKDCVKIKDGVLTLSADTGNGIQSKNDEDATKGYVYVAGGEITVLKSSEGIEGTVILIDDGAIDITAEDDGLNSASGGSGTAGSDAAGSDTAKPEDFGTAGKTGTAEGGSSGETRKPPVNPEIDAADSAATGSADTADAKREGPEGGNPGGGFDRGNFGGGGFGGGGAFEADADCYISIQGGTININASGDGIDSNGSLYVSGGSIYVSGPTDSGNGALDYNGTAEITGGTVIAAGSTGMAQGFSDTSSQYSLLYNLTAASAAGTKITLTDDAGTVIASYKPDKEYQSIVISTPDLMKDKTYTLTSGEQSAQITLTAIVTGNAKQGMGSPGGRGSRPAQNGNTEEISPTP